MIRHRYMLPKYRRQEHRLRDSYKEQDCYEETDRRRGQIGLNETSINIQLVGVHFKITFFIENNVVILYIMGKFYGRYRKIRRRIERKISGMV